MHKKIRFIWLLAGLLAVLASIPARAFAEAGGFPAGQNQVFIGRLISGYFSAPVDQGAQATPDPSAAISADSCTSCDAFDMKVLSVTLTALVHPPGRSSVPEMKNGLTGLFIAPGVGVSIALIALVIYRFRQTRIENRQSESGDSNHIEIEDNHAGQE